MENLRMKYLRLLSSVKLKPKRYLYDIIDWHERFVIIKGQRGTGKTTLVLQYIKSTIKNLDESLYVSLDDIYFSGNKLSDMVEEFVTGGGKYLFIDEVHRYKGWSLELKNIYDFYPELKIVITGSSALSFFIHSADLGRRASIYDLPELSFREYIYFVEGVLFETISLSDIIGNHNNLALSINSKIKSVKLFREYLRMGVYPYVLTNRTKYPEKVEASINTVIDNDIPAIENISYESRIKMKKLLLMMATSSPFKINISELSRKMETSRDILTKYLNLLSQAGIIKLLTSDGIGYQIIRKPDKVYFSNSNLMYAINEKPDIGTIRETFFLNQLSTIHKINYSKSTDFLVNEKYLFEIGGKNKTNKQIKDMQDAYLAVDDTEYGYKNKIPLWLFGFLY